MTAVPLHTAFLRSKGNKSLSSQLAALKEQYSIVVSQVVTYLDECISTGTGGANRGGDKTASVRESLCVLLSVTDPSIRMPAVLESSLGEVASCGIIGSSLAASLTAQATGKVVASATKVTAVANSSSCCISALLILSVSPRNAFLERFLSEAPHGGALLSPAAAKFSHFALLKHIVTVARAANVPSVGNISPSRSSVTAAELLVKGNIAFLTAALGVTPAAPVAPLSMWAVTAAALSTIACPCNHAVELAEHFTGALLGRPEKAFVDLRSAERYLEPCGSSLTAYPTALSTPGHRGPPHLSLTAGSAAFSSVALVLRGLAAKEFIVRDVPEGSGQCQRDGIGALIANPSASSDLSTPVDNGTTVMLAALVPPTAMYCTRILQQIFAFLVTALGAEPRLCTTWVSVVRFVTPMAHLLVDSTQWKCIPSYSAASVSEAPGPLGGPSASNPTLNAYAAGTVLQAAIGLESAACGSAAVSGGRGWSGDACAVAVQLFSIAVVIPLTPQTAAILIAMCRVLLALREDNSDVWIVMRNFACLDWTPVVPDDAFFFSVCNLLEDYGAVLPSIDHTFCANGCSRCPVMECLAPFRLHLALKLLNMLSVAPHARVLSVISAIHKLALPAAAVADLLSQIVDLPLTITLGAQSCVAVAELGTEKGLRFAATTDLPYVTSLSWMDGLGLEGGAALHPLHSHVNPAPTSPGQPRDGPAINLWHTSSVNLKRFYAVWRSVVKEAVETAPPATILVAAQVAALIPQLLQNLVVPTSEWRCEITSTHHGNLCTSQILLALVSATRSFAFFYTFTSRLPPAMRQHGIGYSSSSVSKKLHRIACNMFARRDIVACAGPVIAGVFDAAMSTLVAHPVAIDALCGLIALLGCAAGSTALGTSVLGDTGAAYSFEEHRLSEPALAESVGEALDAAIRAHQAASSDVVIHDVMHCFLGAVEVALYEMSLTVRGPDGAAKIAAAARFPVLPVARVAPGHGAVLWGGSSGTSGTGIPFSTWNTIGQSLAEVPHVVLPATSSRIVLQWCPMDLEDGFSPEQAGRIICAMVTTITIIAAHCSEATPRVVVLLANTSRAASRVLSRAVAASLRSRTSLLLRLLVASPSIATRVLLPPSSSV